MSLSVRAIISRIVPRVRDLKRQVAASVCIDFILQNMPQVIAAADFISHSMTCPIPIPFPIPLLIGICYTKPDRLGRMIEDNNLPRTITVDITKPLADKIAVPFGQKFKALIDSMAADPKDARINKPVKMKEPEINDLAIEDTLFEMLGKINSDPEAIENYDDRRFREEYLTNLAVKMKKEYFQDQPITVEQIRLLIRDLKIDGRRNIAEMIANWIEDNGVFGDAPDFGFSTTRGGTRHA